MAIVGVDTKCYILALFIRSDGERFLLGSGRYEFNSDQMHFEANTMANDVVEVQGNDGYLLAGQVRRPGTQSFDGYVGDGTTSKTDVETYRRAFFEFFRKNYSYKVIYVFPDGSAIQRKRGFLVDAPTVKELYQQYPAYHVALNFEDINYYYYNENADGQEIYGKSATIGLAVSATGGLIWDALGAVSIGYTWASPVEVSGSEITINNQLSVPAPTENQKLYGDTSQQASPTPTTPQTVNVVTGAQTVTINGEQICTIDLGSIELCKIGDYQDYIYRDADGDWYVYKAIGKYVIDGSENWVNYQDSIFYADNISMDTPVNSTIRCYNNYYQGVNSSSTASNFVQSTNNLSFAINTHTRNNLVRIKDTRYTQASDLVNWFTTHNTSLYYAIATPTDTKITDNTLIGQLEALGTMEIFVGTNTVTTSATGTNLPAILDFEYYTEVDIDKAGYEWEPGEAGGDKNIMVDSIDNVYPLLTITGPAVNPTITNITTGAIFAYSGTVTASQVLKVDMMAKTATLNGVSVLGNVTQDWLYFKPGNNRVEYTTDNTDSPDALIEWQEIVG